MTRPSSLHQATVLRSVVAVLLATVLALPAAAQSGPAMEKLSDLEARSIGPAGMSGRIAAIDALEADPDLVYVGAATGGLWKSENGGTTWQTVFDDQRVNGIGAVKINQNAPDIVWVGTGEGNPRNSAGVGAGVYRSIDGGETWSFLGLGESERIHRIVLHPTDPDVAWVGAMGPAWSDSEQRGVFKTVDGGRTWEKVLYVDERTGVSDMVQDPMNPRKIFVGMWEYRRYPWFFESGGEGSGLYVTHDGGESWTEITSEDGLPAGELGRIGLAVFRHDPRIVYALIEAEQSGLAKSTDGGRTWDVINTERGVVSRPFYYTDIFVDPRNELRLYNLQSRVQISEDGGRSFETMRADVHSDFHAIWIDPNDPDDIYIGTDGGVFISDDGAETWRVVDNLPVGQFYHLSVDNDVPFNVYGGMQDNGSWKGPSTVWEVDGIRNWHWEEVAFGDGFGTVVAPDDPDFGYAMSQGGNLYRFDLRTGERKPIRPYHPDDSVELRFNWNAAIAVDPHERGTIYYGSQFLHRSPDRGDSWETLGPDLTTDNPEWQRQDESGGLTRDVTGAENFTTITTIAPSPVREGVIWVGTDDGNVQLTTDGGVTWTNLAEELTDRGVTPNTWVPHIEASKHDAGTAYVVFDDHRRGGWTPWIFRTTNFGEDWENVAEGIDGFVHVIEEDPVEPNLLFAGSEFGLWMSLDGGESWEKWTHGFPTAPVRALVVHPRDHDLAIGSYGRAVHILDDIRPLRGLASSPRIVEAPVTLFEPPPAIIHQTKAVDGYHFSADHFFKGETRPYGALLTYWVGQQPVMADDAAGAGESMENGSAGDARRPRAGGPRTGSGEGAQQARGRPGGGEGVTVEILDASGEVVREMDGPAEPGMNRVVWNLRAQLPDDGDDEGSRSRFAGGPEVLPGSYTVRVTVGEASSEQALTVLPDPRVDIPMADRRAKYDAIVRGLLMNREIGELQQKERELEQAVERVMTLLGDRDDEAARAVKQAAAALEAAADSLTGMDEVNRHRRAVFAMLSSWDAPTRGELLGLERMEEALEAFKKEAAEFLATDVAEFRETVQAADIDVFPEIELEGGGG